MMAKNEVLPLYRPVNDVTGVATAPVTGGQFVDIDGTLVGLLPSVTTAAAGARSFGVAATDSDPKTNRVAIIRGAKVILPVTAGGAIAAGDEIQVGPNGSAVRKAAGVVGGRAVSTAASGESVYVELH